MRRWLRRIGWATLGLVLLAAAAVGLLARASLPQLASEIAVPALAGPVSIARDDHGVPTLTAGSEADAYFAMGFVHGQDRLWQMEFDRLAGQGRLAEILGTAALPHDRFVRTLGLEAAAASAAAALDAETAALLGAYAAGVNAAIAAFGMVLPPEFLILRHRPEPWRPVDSIRFLKLMALTLSGDWRQELQRARFARTLRDDQMALLWPGLTRGGPITMAALAGLPLDRLAAALPEAPPPGIGSNVWVVSGARSATGGPLLANDPHLGFQMPGQWYLARLQAPGLSIDGATLPSVPFVVLGRNPDLAWGFTNTGSDTQDLFIERIDPSRPDHYLTPDGSQPFQRRSETIAVRGAASERLDIRATRHGPVISDLLPDGAAGDGHVLALAWTQLQDDRPDTTAAAGFALSRARTVARFLAAAERYRGAQQNIAFATADGHIGMISPGAVPIRRSGDGRLPVPGWTSDHDWIGTIPVDRLPRLLDPPSGQIVNANNRLVDDSYPFLLGSEWDEPFRAERIDDLLAVPGPLDGDRFARIQLDQSTGLAADLRPYLPDPAGLPDELRPLRDALADWDGTMDPHRPEPLLFSAWRRAFARELAARLLGDGYVEFATTRGGFLRRALARCPSQPDWCQAAGRDALIAATRELRQRLGDSWQEWRWGEAHPAMLGHRPFDLLPGLAGLFSRMVPFGGDPTTVNVAGTRPTDDGATFSAVHGAGYRAIYDLAHPTNSRWIAATGQAGHPMSPHYDDLVALWRDGAYLPMPAGEAKPSRILRLTPATQP